MSWCRTLILPILVGLVLLLAGAIGQQPGSKTTSKPSSLAAGPVSAKADIRATTILADALKKLEPGRITWVQTDLWQQANLQGLMFQSEGTYLSAPGHRQHLIINVHLADTTGKLEVVSDGTNLWEALQIGKEERVITKKIEMKKVLATLTTPQNKPQVVKQVQEEFFQAQSFTGVTPLLQNIQQKMIMTGQELTTLNGHRVIKLQGSWSKEAAKGMSNPGAQWPPYMPRFCQLYLSEQTGWPYRIEWWGPSPPLQGDALLVEMEFRNPKLNQPVTEERLAREFKFDPGTGDNVRDETREVHDWFRGRYQQLASDQKKGK